MKLRSVIALGLVARGVLALACAPPSDAPGGPDGIDLGKADFAASGTLWRNPHIPVCWEDLVVASALSPSRAEVLPAVRIGDVDADGRDDVPLFW